MNKNSENINKDVIIVDIDGTLSLMEGIRGPYDYDKVHLDKPNKPIIKLIKILSTSKYTNIKIFIFSGRMNKKLKKPIKINGINCFDTIQLTISWINEHLGRGFWDNIFLREDLDFRCDRIIKKEMYEEHIKDKYNVLYVIDDRERVVNMWRDDLGLTTLQVAKGDF